MSPALPKEDAAEVIAGMRLVSKEGLNVARHLRGDIFEVRVDTADPAFRILFAKEGKTRQVLLALDAFEKRTQRTPPAEIPAEVCVGPRPRAHRCAEP